MDHQDPLAALQCPGTPTLNRPQCQQKKPSGALPRPELTEGHSRAAERQHATCREQGAIGSIPGTHDGPCLGSTALNKSLDFSVWNAKASANSQRALLSALRIHNYSRAHKVILERCVWLQQVQSAGKLTTELFHFCHQHFYCVCLQIFQNIKLIKSLLEVLLSQLLSCSLSTREFFL